MLEEILKKLVSKGLSLDDVREEIKNYSIGVDPRISFTNNSPNIFILDALSIMTKAVNNEIQLAKRDLNLESAEDVALQNIGFITSGILKTESSKTLVKASIEGELGLFLKQGFEIKDNTSTNFFLKDEVLLQNTNIYEVILEGNTLDEEKKFVLKFERTSKTFSSRDADWVTILKDAINYDIEVNFFCGASVSKDGNLIITARENDFSIFFSSGVKYKSLNMSAFFEAENVGALNFNGIPVFESQEQLNNIKIVSVLIGKNAQSQEDYRTEVFETRNNFGSKNNRLKNAILKENPQVSYISIMENSDSDKQPVDEYGIKYKHIECVIEGGESQSVAYSIWNHKRSVSTQGDVTVRITDDFGKTHGVKFSRPESIATLLNILIKSEKPIDKERAEEYMKLLVPKFVSQNNKIGEPFSLGRLGAYLTNNFTDADKIEVSANTSKQGTLGTEWKADSVIKVGYKEVLEFKYESMKITLSNELKK
jgi:hypothetical protein